MAINEKSQAQAQMEGLATLLVLDDEIRKLNSTREFGFFATNETHRLIRYHTAYLWEKRDIIGTHIVAQSGTAELDIHAPANQWLKEKIKEICNTPHAKEIHQIDYQQSDLDPSLAYINSTITNWADSLPHYLLWCPFLNKSKDIVGGLIFFKEKQFTESEIKMLGWLIASYQFTWLVLAKQSKLSLAFKLKKKPYLIAAYVLIVIILLFPIRISVLATATVVPRDPVLINAPIQGVIKSFSVSPGQTVNPGQVLLTLDKTDLQSTAEVSQKELQLTQAKLRTAISEGLNNPASQAEVPILKAQIAIDQANLNYTMQQLKKAEVTSPISGVVVFDSKEDWVGQPVQTGERILSVADPKKVELKIILPVSDVIKLNVGSDGDFFLYGQLSGLSVKLSTLGYNAKVMPNKILAYQLSADFTDKTDAPQLGAQGTVRLYGHRVPVFYYFLRRPLQYIRQKLGI